MRNIKWTISENIGQVSGIVQLDNQSDCLLVLGHGAGAGMTHLFMEQLANALFEQKIGVVRYQFPYMEKGKRRPDYPAVAHKTIEVVCEDVRKQYKLPILLSGKSFGGRMASQWISKASPDYVKGLIFYGFPLHSFSKVGVERAEHLSNISMPMLFLQGTKDRLAQKELISQVCEKQDNADLVFFRDADHSFKVPKRTGLTQEDVIRQMAQHSREWIDRVILK